MASLKEFLGSTGLGALWARITEELNKKATSADLADVATSGSYNDLEDKPFIPSAVSDLVDDSGHYTKPVTGIPASDLEETYLTSFTETDPTVPSWAKEAEKPTYTAVEVGAMATNHPASGITAANITSWTKKSALLSVNSDHNNVYDYWWLLSIPRDALWNINNAPGSSGVLKYLQLPTKSGSDLTKLELPTSNGKIALITDIPAWARATNKPTYTAQEVGALPADTVIPTVPTNVSAFTNDAGYLTQHQDISGKADKSEIPTSVSELTNDTGYITGYTETDPTVPAWAKASIKPSYTAAEVGAPTVAEMNSAIGDAIGNVHQFEIEIVQELPVANIKEHTVYFVPKSGVTNDVYDEYIYTNNAWEMIGNTQIDLSNYATKAEIPIVPSNVSAFTNDAGYLTQHQDISGKANVVDLATVATSGSYEDLSNKPIIPAVPVQDVQVNGTSVLSSGVANIPMATTSVPGAIILGPTLEINASGKTIVKVAGSGTVKSGTSAQTMITPMYQHESVFYGLTKAAGVDMSSSSNAVGTYTESAKTAIRSMIGATSSNIIAVQDTQPVEADAKIWMMETAPESVEVPTMEDLEGYVQKTDLATTATLGIVKARDFGIKVNSSGELYISKAEISSEVKPGAANYLPIVPSNQHAAVFYGLAKVAGADLASETVTLGTYPTTTSAAIRTMLGAVGDVQVNGTSIVSNGVANIPIASASTFGVVKCGTGLSMMTGEHAGKINTNPASTSACKNGAEYYAPITPNHQHEATFYGLAKAAGDTTMASSSNAVGTYTTEAKAAIHAMLGIDPASIAAQVDIPLVETVSGTTPTITGQPNVRYVCGEVSTITITPPASGSVDVIFESGSTATAMTVPSTVKWPAWFDAETLEANTTYEILITDGIYGSVMTWAT